MVPLTHNIEVSILVFENKMKFNIFQQGEYIINNIRKREKIYTFPLRKYPLSDLITTPVIIFIRKNIIGRGNGKEIVSKNLNTDKNLRSLSWLHEPTSINYTITCLFGLINFSLRVQLCPYHLKMNDDSNFSPSHTKLINRKAAIRTHVRFYSNYICS